MPGAKTHDLITVVTAAGADAAYATQTQHPDPTIAVLFTVAYLFAGYACAGDLDLYSREYLRWGPLRFIWLPYRALVPHRSWISHGLLLGGIIRVCYLLAVVSLLSWSVLWLVSRLGPHVNPDAAVRGEWSSLLGFAHVHPQWTLAVLAGFILAGSAHALADIIYSGIKRRL